MTQFSANLGFLWAALNLPDAIRAAAKAGFDAVECHWPYAEDSNAVNAALVETGLPMLGLNTDRGDVAGGENGLSALPGRKSQARAAIDQGLEYGAVIGAQNLHVMAGITSDPAAFDCFVENLKYAASAAQDFGIGILIEPLNAHDAPDYVLRTNAQAREILQAVDAPNVKLMFDCYHCARTEGHVSDKLEEFYDIIGHIQFAGVPDRGRPDVGALDYAPIFRKAVDLGWTGPLGAEYKPFGPTEPTLGWMQTLRV